MQFTTLVHTLAVSAFASSVVARRTCANVEIPEANFEAAKQFAIEAENSSSLRKAAAAATIKVDVHFNVIQAGADYSQGNIPDSQLQDQMAVLNDNYGPAGITFNLVSINRTTNAEWFTGLTFDSPIELAMKTILRKGDYKTLNIYFADILDLGWCSFPQVTAPYANSSAFLLDGCVIRYTTLPDGSEKNYNLGKTLTHEVGHWMNLFHTFEGGCQETGDLIADTPAEKSQTFGCPVGQDSCTELAGLDPVHNYMDYTDDNCMDEFTPGQITRIMQSWEAYRA